MVYFDAAMMGFPHDYVQMRTVKLRLHFLTDTKLSASATDVQNGDDRG